MKKVTTIVTFLTAILLLASCAETEKDYSFYNQAIGAYVESGESISDEDLAKINNLVRQENPYFAKEHIYFGLWENTFNAAFAEFETACNSLDTSVICPQIPAGAVYAIYLVSPDKGLVAISQYFYSSQKEEEKEE